MKGGSRKREKRSGGGGKRRRSTGMKNEKDPNVLKFFSPSGVSFGRISGPDFVYEMGGRREEGIGKKKEE